MSKRDYVAEILEIRTRAGEKAPFLGVLQRIRDIRLLIDGPPTPPLEGLRYCPVGLVACMEAYFRTAIRDLINLGSPFSERASRIERIRFDFTTVSAIQGKTITLGDLVAHLVPLSKKADINSVMSTLLDMDFLDHLKLVRNKYPWKPEPATPSEAVIGDPSITFSDLDRVFELRHIVCHEFARITLSREEVDRLISSVETFLEATDFMVTQLLFGDIPSTQSERNEYFRRRLASAEDAMQVTLIAADEVFVEERRVALEKLQNAWKSYRNQEAAFVADAYAGGSIRPQIHAQRLEHLTRQRIGALKELIENERP